MATVNITEAEWMIEHLGGSWTGPLQKYNFFHHHHYLPHVIYICIKIETKKQIFYHENLFTFYKCIYTILHTLHMYFISFLMTFTANS